VSLVRVPEEDIKDDEDEEQKHDRIDGMRENLVANVQRILGNYCMSLPT
jgi:hypothetical protein